MAYARINYEEDLKLCKSTSAGRWHTSGYYHVGRNCSNIWAGDKHVASINEVISKDKNVEITIKERNANARFIVRAKKVIPAYINRCKKLEKEIETLKEKLSKYE